VIQAACRAIGLRIGLRIGLVDRDFRIIRYLREIGRRPGSLAYLHAIGSTPGSVHYLRTGSDHRIRPVAPTE